MKKSYAQKLIVLGVAGVTAGMASLTLSSTGVAGASPDMSGKTFSEAQAALGAMGYTAVAATVIGDKASQGNCKVVRQQDFPTSNVFVGGDQPTLYPVKLPNVPTAGQVLLTLSCYNAKDAAPGQATGSGDINTKKPGS